MSVIQVGSGGSGILGTLGTLASLGGTMFGVPLLTTLGTGMSGVDALMNGGGNANTITQTGGALADGNVASTAGKVADIAKRVQKQSDEDLARKWGYKYGGWFQMATIIQPYNPWMEQLAASILVPMVSGALERQRQRDENRKQNALKGEVLKQLGQLQGMANAQQEGSLCPSQKGTTITHGHRLTTRRITLLDSLMQG